MTNEFGCAEIQEALDALPLRIYGGRSICEARGGHA